MNPATVLDFVNLFFAGILAGIEIVIHYGLRAPTEVLDEQSQIQLRQALVLRLRVLVPVRGSARRAHLDLDQGHRHRPYQQCHAHLAARRATKELESASQPRGAVPYCWCLGGGHGICVLLDSRGTQTGRSLTFEKAASIHEIDQRTLLCPTATMYNCCQRRTNIFLYFLNISEMQSVMWQKKSALYLSKD